LRPKLDSYAEMVMRDAVVHDRVKPSIFGRVRTFWRRFTLATIWPDRGQYLAERYGRTRESP